MEHAPTPHPLSDHIVEVLRLVERAVRRRIYDPQDREDARQDVLVAMVREWERNPWDPRKGSLAQWVELVARRALVDRTRRKRVPTAAHDSAPEPAYLEAYDAADLRRHCELTVPAPWKGDVLAALEGLSDGLRPPELRQRHEWTERRWRSILARLREAVAAFFALKRTLWPQK